MKCDNMACANEATVAITVAVSKRLQDATSTVHVCEEHKDSMKGLYIISRKAI